MPTHFKKLGHPVPPGTDLSPTSILPATPKDLFTTILPLTPPDATKSPRYVKELWDDFDKVGFLSSSCVPPPPPPSPVSMNVTPKYAMPRMGIWLSNTSNSTSKRDDIPAQLPRPAAQRAFPSFPLGSHFLPASPQKEKNRRQPRGLYRCRKCGGAKRAHDCPFACRQKSMGTQTNLDITGKGSVRMASNTFN